MRTLLPLLALCISLSTVAAAQGGSPDSGTGFSVRAVSTSWLAEHRADPSLVVLQVTPESEFRAGHVPGARHLEYASLITRRGELSSELPEPEALRAVFEGLGVSNHSQVVVYGHQGPMFARVLFTLAYLGLPNLAMLDGGLEQWRAEGRAMETGAVAASPRGKITTTPRPELVATADWIMANTGRPGVAFLDTRTAGEYLGTGNRSGMPSAGHVVGARQLDWEELFQNGVGTLLKPQAELERIFAERVGRGDVVVTYCWVGYRASATWMVATLLGYDARLYDGSYQDWQQRGLPVRAGAVP